MECNINHDREGKGLKEAGIAYVALGDMYNRVVPERVAEEVWKRHEGDKSK